jgi:pyrroline-5-carboxylate reductase
MEIEREIGFIGAGNMAEAMIRGLLGRGVFPPERVLASAPREGRAVELRERWRIEVTPDNGEVARRSAIVVLAVKPQVLLRVIDQIRDDLRDDQLVISIAAGVPLHAIEARAGKRLRLVRAMPNTPVLVESGATAIAAGAHAREEDLALAKTIFDTVGVTAVVEETHLDAVTGLSGSGPAYAFLIVEALSDAGVRVGLNRRTSQLLAAQTLLGAARLLLETGTHPAQLREMVTSPGGTAIAGLHVLEANAVRAAMMSAVEAATRRAAELGEKFSASPAASARNSAPSPS